MSLTLMLASLMMANPLVLLSSYVSAGNSFPQPLSEEEETFFLERFEAGDKAAKDVLVEHNLRLVAHIAKKYGNTGKEPDDLISIGTIGLIKAVNTYNRKKGVSLATYAARCIENEILMSIRAAKKIRTEVSISEPIGTDKDGNEISFNDILGSDGNEILENIETRIRIKQLYKAIETRLTEREKRILIRRFGLTGRRPMAQREVAKEMGISRSYVSRIEKKALEKLREEFERNEM